MLKTMRKAASEPLDFCDIQPKPIHPRGGKTVDRGYDTAGPEFTLAFKHYLGKTLPRGR